MPLPVFGAVPGVAPGVQAMIHATGTAFDAISDTDIVSGGKTIILTLTGTEWVAAGALFNAQRQAIINKLDSDASEINGWDAELDNIAVTDVVRTSSTVATITLPALGDYAITAPENVTCGAPSAALTTAGGDLTAPETFSIASEPTSAALTGTITTVNTLDIRAGGKTIILTLTGLTWLPAGGGAGQFDGVRQAILNGIASGVVWAAGWDNEVIAKTALTAVARSSPTVVTITLAAQTGYFAGVEGKETITATIPTVAVTGLASPIVVSETFTILYEFVETWEQWITETKLKQNNFDIFRAQGGPWTQKLAQRADSTHDAAIGGDGQWPVVHDSDNVELEVTEARANNGSKSMRFFLGEERERMKVSIIKDELVATDPFYFLSGDIVSTGMYYYFPAGTNAWVGVTSNSPRLIDLGSNTVAKISEIRVSTHGTNSILSINRKSMGHKTDVGQQYSTNVSSGDANQGGLGTYSFPTDVWFKLELRMKLGHIPTDDEANYPGAGIGDYTFDSTDAGWYQIIVDDVIEMQTSCTTLGGVPADNIYVNSLEIGLTISSKSAEVFMDDVWLRPVFAHVS